jgi:DNA-binding transcriptional LysR family regulator
MELLQLQYFYELARTQHVTKTAEALHIAQPALTQTIHRLEKELSVKLFKKNGRNIVLTEAGEYLKEKLEPVLKTLSDLPDELQNLSAERQKLIKVNVLAASNLVTGAIIEFQKEYGGINFQIVQNTEAEQADVTIFTREFFMQPEHKKHQTYIFTEKIFLAVPKSSEIAGRESISLKEVAGKGFIALAGSRGLRTICDRFCMHAGFKPNIVFESDSPAAVINMISASLGVGFWPQYSWGRPDEEKIALIPIDEPPCQRDIVVRMSEEAGSESVMKFYIFLAHYFESIKS